MLAAVGSSLLLEVGLVLLVFVAVLAWLRRRVALGAGLGREGGERRLSPQHALHVVELEGKRLLIGTGPNAAPQLLCELEAGDHTGES